MKPKALTRHLLNLALALGLLWLMADRAHFKQGHLQFGDWESAAFADPSGYYVYLPATFLAGWDGRKFPEGAQDKAGLGFAVHFDDGRIDNKYTYVVALLQSPFFLVAHQLTLSEGLPTDGFSHYYRMVPVWAGCFYGWLGLLLVRAFLQRRYSQLVSWLVVMGLLLGTNLLYYATDKGGFAHVYNFFMASGFLLLLDAWVRRPGKGLKLAALLGLGALMFVSRPTLVVLLGGILLWGVGSRRELMPRIRSILRQWPGILLGGALAFLVAVPQMMYWHYFSGSWLFYSYHDEGFSNALHPDLPLVWFAPGNGMFPYAPLLFFMLVGCLVLILHRRSDSGEGRHASTGRLGYVFVLLLFLYLSYTSASWHMPSFGCSFGHRNLVDFLPWLALGLAEVLHQLGRLSLKAAAGSELSGLLRRLPWAGLAWRLPVALLMLGCVWVTLRLDTVYTSYWAGETPWDWKEYRTMLEISPTTVVRNFENASLPGAEQRKDAPQGQHVIHMSPGMESVQGIDLIGSKRSRYGYRHALLSVWVRTETPQPIALMIVRAATPQSLRYSMGWYVLEDIKTQGEWTHYVRRMALPIDLPPETHYLAYPSNPNKSDFWMDELKLYLY